jgi:RNA recognition motif-containing protein
MLIPSDMSQTFVFAQNSTSILDSTPITPSLEPSGSDDESSSSNDDDNDDNNADDNGDNESSDSSAFDNNNPQDDTSSSEEIEDEYEQTNPLREQIRERVAGALSDSSGSDDSDEQNTSLSETEDETDTENTETVSLLEQITNNVTGTLSSNGLG